MKKINLLFTDLDATLLDSDYRPKKGAEECISSALKKNFVIVFTSSKTFEEQRYYSVTLGIPAIYIVENGSAIYIPEKYFDNNSYKNGCRKFELVNIHYTDIKKILEALQKIQSELKYYGNSNIAEISQFTGLPLYLARLAAQREYTETIFRGFTRSIEQILMEKELVPQKGSKFITIGGKTDKGKAAKFLIKILRKNGFAIERTVGIGDGPNDISLLKAVQEPYIIGNKISIDNARYIGTLQEISF